MIRGFVCIQAEIEGRKGVFVSLQKFGERLLDEDFENKETLEQNLLKLEEIKSNVSQCKFSLLFKSPSPNRGFGAHQRHRERKRMAGGTHLFSSTLL